MIDFTMFSGANISAFLAGGVAVAVPVAIAAHTHSARRRELVIELWKMWASKDYRQYRIESAAAIRNAQKGGAPALAAILKEMKSPEAIGSIEHFFVEISQMKKEGLLDARLLSKIFADEVAMWRGLLMPLNCDGADAFPREKLEHAFNAIVRRP